MKVSIQGAERINNASINNGNIPRVYARRHRTHVPLFVRLLITVDRGRLVFCYFSFKSCHIIVWRPAVFSDHSVVPVHGGGVAVHAVARQRICRVRCMHRDARGVNSPVVI